uniref:Uncharacterized protein n=1 Tax=Lepeophtheirus salmonis TaxID=72036 RepID=A0A0K2VJA9_LEPSM
MGVNAIQSHVNSIYIEEVKAVGDCGTRAKKNCMERVVSNFLIRMEKFASQKASNAQDVVREATMQEYADVLKKTLFRSLILFKNLN